MIYNSLSVKILVNLAKLHILFIFRIPQQVGTNIWKCSARTSPCGYIGNHSHPVLRPKNFIQQQPYSHKILVSHLHENAAFFCQQFSAQMKSVSHICQIAVDA